MVFANGNETYNAFVCHVNNHIGNWFLAQEIINDWDAYRKFAGIPEIITFKIF